jgi:hypothetical protein
MRVAFALTFAALTGLLGCSQPCDGPSLCAIDSNRGLCDGTAWVICDDTVRGKQVACPTTHRTAVCTLDGWTFQTSGQ